ncbi:MAG TPA: TAT-variant-translocated molybdopterin oxidoreductase [Terriglobia bacterium]|nr:TAT-variant-translocated molybdopterin oxidoreductase [Terriglobia bacterium]
MSGQDNGKERLDLVSIRTKADSAPDGKLWRSLDELAGTEEYQKFADHEFPYGTEKSRLNINRRDALKLMGASAALAGLTACTKLPVEKIVPYVNAPEGFVPGKPLFYASTMPWQGVGQGVVVWSFMGRPTKVEGNNDQPGSLGKANIFTQASVLDVYDPDRSQVSMHNGYVGSWSDFLVEVDELRAAHLRNQGEGLRFLTGTVTSPTLGDQMHDLLKQFPKAQWHQYESITRDNAREGARMAFGDYTEVIYSLDQADVVVSLDSDFLFSHPAGVRHAVDFANKRRVTGPQSRLNRLYAVEGTPTITGSQAEHRLRLKPSQVEAFARILAGELGVKAQGIGQPSLPNVPSGWVPALVKDLQNHRGSSLIIAGDSQPPAVHALAHAMNDALGNAGKTVVYTESIEASPVNQTESFRQLTSDMGDGKVQTLVILGGNPVYAAPADVPFAANLGKVRLRIYLGFYEDETSELCNWHIPAAHYLESWGDVRAYDGTVSTIQPLIAPLYDGKSAYDLLTLFQGQPGRTGRTIVHDYWQSQQKKLAADQFEVQWETWLEKGVIDNTAMPPKQVAPNKGLDVTGGATAGSESGLEVIFMPDPSLWDGSYSNNGWLQELPKPFSKLTWDNAVMVSPATADRIRREQGAVSTEGMAKGNGEGGKWYNVGPTNGIKNEVVELNFQGRKVAGPLLAIPGHADDCVLVYLGYGRKRAGRIGTGNGFNANAIRTSKNLWFGTGLKVSPTGAQYELVVTQHHHIMGSGKNQGKEMESVAAFKRDVVRIASLDEFRQNPDFAKDPPDMTTDAQSLYPALPSPYDFKKGPQWGMSIDLTSCIGCNACVIACQAENNIAVVGKDQVARGREMQWIRVDTYYRGGTEEPEIYNEIVPCMQCENAPCEYVCPVGATVTGPQGINEQIYNRCVGTRYCSNNCPYKVRRFNFYLYADWNRPSLYGVRNPKVTVRSRGVMEKCTYCIQRIRAHEIEAEEQGRQLKDGEILTACQQTCPADAIVFGDILDPESKVSKLRAQSRKYGLLEELNTRPRTTYLAKIWNPNPEMKES